MAQDVLYLVDPCPEFSILEYGLAAARRSWGHGMRVRTVEAWGRRRQPLVVPCAHNEFSKYRDIRNSTYITVGKVSTDRQYKKFSSTDDDFFCTVGI